MRTITAMKRSRSFGNGSLDEYERWECPDCGRGYHYELGAIESSVEKCACGSVFVVKWTAAKKSNATR